MNIQQYLFDLYKQEGLILENQSKKKQFKKISGVDTGFSITENEIDYFSKYKEEFKNPKIFIIGNAFGYSTFTLHKIFQNSSIDVIDAEIEGEGNKQGSEITNRIISQNNFDIKLTIGFSPEDVYKAARYTHYDIIFIDGLHTNEQLLKDFNEIKKYFNPDKFICFFHDVGYCRMEESTEQILNQYLNEPYDSIVKLPNELSFSEMGVLSKNIPIIKK